MPSARLKKCGTTPKRSGRVTPKLTGVVHSRLVRFAHRRWITTPVISNVIWLSEEHDAESDLPRWACVAYCARAAELVHPFVMGTWENMTTSNRETLVDTIGAAKEAATNGQVSERFTELAIANSKLAGRIQLHVNGIRSYEDLPSDLELCRALSNAINVGSKSHECATDKNHSQARLWAFDAYMFACELPVKDPIITEEITRTYRSLSDIAVKERWNHGTHVTWTPEGWLGTHAVPPWWCFWKRKR